MRHRIYGERRQGRHGERCHESGAGRYQEWISRARHARLLVGLALAGILLLSSCTREQTAFLRVADLLPLLDLQVGTGTILPSSGAVAHELGDGWVGRSSSPGPRIGVRARSQRAELHIIAAAPGDLVMTFEARALSQPDDGPQTLTIVLGGEPLETIEVGDEYEAHSVRLPEGLLRAGKNLVVWEFAAVGPVESVDSTVMGAARVRRLAIRNSLGRSPAASLSGDLSSVTRAEQTVDSGVMSGQPAMDHDLLMPADSVLELALEVPEGARISAELIRSLSDATQAGENDSHEQSDDRLEAEDIFASIEVVDSDGTAEVAYEHAFGAGSIFSSPDRTSLDLSLEDWSGEKILLRLQVWGGKSGQIAWEDLRITCNCDTTPPAYMACDLPEIPSSGRLGRPDIFVILLDAARADAFSTFGADRPTPSVDNLAAGGTKFTAAIAPASWTAPTTASLLTGRYPDAHGVEDWDRRLPGSITTLTQILADAGYYTFLGSHHNVYRGNQPLRKGFEGVELIDIHERSRLPDPEAMFTADRPTFALIHLLPPHGPYEPPPPYRGLYTSNSEAVIDVSVDSLNSYSRTRVDLSEEAVSYARARYDENVAYADALVDKFLGTLRQHDRYDNALVILLADHGEAFYEHGQFLHRPVLYNEVLRIPLVMKWPADTDGYNPVVDAPVSLVDLGPTLLDGLGIDDPRARFQGVSLLPTIFEGLTPNRAVYATAAPSSETGRRGLALQRAQTKIILSGEGAPQLYDLSLDPQEQQDKARSEPVRVQLLLQELLAQQRCNQMLLNGVEQAPRIELDAERLRELRALGYIQ